MLKNEYISQYEGFTINNGVPVKILELPIQVDDRDSSNFYRIEIKALNQLTIMSCDLKIQTNYGRNTDSYNVNISYDLNSDKRISVRAKRDDNILKIYVKINSSGLHGFVKVTESFNKQFIYTNEIETPTGDLIEPTRTSLYTFADNVVENTTFPDCSYCIDNSKFSINVGVRITTNLEANTAILNLSTRVGNGYLIATNGEKIYPIRVSSNKAYCPYEVASGYYVLKLNGISSGAEPTW